MRLADQRSFGAYESLFFIHAVFPELRRFFPLYPLSIQKYKPKSMVNMVSNNRPCISEEVRLSPVERNCSRESQ
jgi:hypothetical protein